MFLVISHSVSFCVSNSSLLSMDRMSVIQKYSTVRISNPSFSLLWGHTLWGIESQVAQAELRFTKQP